MLHWQSKELIQSLKVGAEHVFAQLDFDYYAICSIQASDFGVCNALPRVHVTNYPQAWMDYYVENRLHVYDPVMHFGRLVTYPTSWNSLSNASGFNEAHCKVLDLARDHGVHSGVCMSIHNLDCSLLLVSMACAQERTLSTTLMKEVYETVPALLDVVQAEPGDTTPTFDLTEREVECLGWCALGKTSSDISAILSISANTVDFHLKSAMRKLATNNRTFAIVKAMRHGIIPL